MHEQSMNQLLLKKKAGQDVMLSRVTHCKGHISANHQLHWGDWVGTATPECI